MYHYFLGYRHGNGEVEGFTQTRFTRERAKAACLAAIVEKASHTPHAFNPANVIKSKAECTPEEFKVIYADWKMIVDPATASADPDWPDYKERY